MAEYIKREDVREKIKEIIDDEWYCPTEESLNRAVEQTMSELPSIDIVRCKDCKRYVSDGGALMVCDITGNPVPEDDYCSCGEREEQE